MPPSIDYRYVASASVTVVSSAKITYSLVAIEKLGSLTSALRGSKSSRGESAD